jgi:UDP-glucose 4-epimerase
VRVLVTGGAGFIGSNLVDALHGHQVVVIDDLSTGRIDHLAGSPALVEFHEASILDTDALAAATEGCEAVVHLAAIGSVPRSVVAPRASIDANVVGTVNVLEAARAVGAQHVIVASSSSVYGANPTLPKVETLLPQPLSPYAVSKLATETAALAWQHCYGLPVLAFRFFNVYGPRQAADHPYAAVIPRFVDAALHQRPLPLHGDGTQSRDFTYVGAVVSTLVDALDRRVAHPTPVNLALGTRATLLEVIAELEQLLEHPLAVEHHPVRTGDVPHSQADPTLLTSLFPHIEPIALADGLRATVDATRAAE